MRHPSVAMPGSRPRWAASGTQHQQPTWAIRAGCKRPAPCSEEAAVDSQRSTAPESRRSWTPRADLRQKLQHASLPAWWVSLCLLAAAAVAKQPLVCGLEVFSGKGQLSAAMRRELGSWASLEKQNDEREDILAEAGLQLVLQRLLTVAV